MSIFQNCTTTLKQGTMIKPDRPMSLRDMCIKGAQNINLDLSQPEYQERLNLELQVIADKEFEDYFFLVADLVQSSNKTQLVGPGRGSSAGSLVCYLLGITQLDPIEHGLLFFRFLDPARTDWPDIDIDFSDRDAAVEYLVNKYGIDRVAKLGTLAKWQAKNTTNEVCKALLISRPEAQKVLDVIPDYAAGDSRGDTALRDALENTPEGKNYLKKYPEFKIAGQMAGNASHAGVHAAGVVVTNDPIDNFIAVNSQKNSTMCDLKEAEQLNLLKLDVLGLDTLTIVDECLKLAGKPRDFLQTIPKNDQKAFKVLNDRKYLGIFQFESTVVSLAKEFYIQSFEDISALMALGRPGPLSSGAAHRWLKKRQGQMEVDYPHEVLKPYLEATFGELIYQETLMLIAHEVAGMDWATVSKLRKAVGKSQGEAAMRGFELDFVDGLVKSGVERDIAERFWQQILGFGSYGFNKSHAACYGLICYWTAYLKAHFPLHFAAASLTQKKDPEKQLEFLRELDKEGVGYIPVDPELSTDKWRVMNNKLIGPLTVVDGLGPKMQKQILSARARNEPLPDRALKLLNNPKTKIDELYPIKKRVEALDKSQFAGEIKLAHEVKTNGTWQEDLLIVGVVEKCSVEDENTESRIQARLSRGQQGKYDGPHKFVELRVASDNGSLYAKIGRNDFHRISPMVVGKVKEGETLIAVRGKLCPMDDFELLLVDKVRVLEDGN